MCLHRVLVIVIVKSWDGRGARFKYINVREEFTMVARLPQQVLLLLVLVTGTTTRTSYEPELSDWTNTGSTVRRGVPSSTRSSRPTSIDEHDSESSYNSRSLLATSNDFGETSKGAEITIANPYSTKTTNSRLDQESSSSDSDSSSNERKSYMSKDRNVDSNEQLDQEDVGLEYRLKIAEDSSTRDEGTSIRVQDTHTKPSASIDDSQYDRFSTLSDARITRSVSLSLSMSFASPSSKLPASGTSGRSPNAETRLPESSDYPKATLGTWRTNDIATTTIGSSTSTHRFDQRFSNLGVQHEGEEFAEFGNDASTPLNSVIGTEEKIGVSDSSIVSKSAGKAKGQANLPVIAALSVHQPNPANGEKVDEPKFPKDFSSDRIIAPTSPGEFRTFKMPEKLESFESRIGGLGLTLAQEEAVEVSSWRFDVPPPDFVYLPNDRRSLDDKVGEIHRTSGKYERRQIDWLTSERSQLLGTTLPTTAVGFPKRYMREVPESVVCEKFKDGDRNMREFYSPGYPQNYTPNADCVRVLEAEKGMLLRLDFREHFALESAVLSNDKADDCRFDFLEVRDGKYGFSPLIGKYCGKKYPPEILSKSRYLWLYFHSDDTLEYEGFKAVWSEVPRPSNSGIPEEQEPCYFAMENYSEVLINTKQLKKEKDKAEQSGVPLDCLWAIATLPEMKMQLSFDGFKLVRPNDCGANFLDVFGDKTEIPSKLKHFCGSIAEAVNTKGNMLYIRLYLEPKAINSSFAALITAVREKTTTDKPCGDKEFDCDDSTCIAASLKCNGRHNCRYMKDEDPADCGSTTDKFDSSRVIIILVIFSLIMFGMCSAFVFNCIRKLRRDHRIIREHIRQSRENRLDEVGRHATPCPVSVSRTDLRDRGSESPSVEVDSSKELIPATTLIARDYTKELVLDMKYGTKDINDIHQSNNVSNATQERLQESSEEPEMCDSSCQTRESLFDPKIPDAVLPSPEFSTFGYRSVSGSQNGVAPTQRGGSQQSHQYRQHPHQTSRMGSQPSHGSQPSNSPPSRHPVSERCSACINPSSREGSVLICPKHYPIPAPPGWSIHDPPYPQIIPATPNAPDGPEYLTYQRYQSPKPEREPIIIGNRYQPHHPTPGFVRQNTVGSGERYGSFIYGSERASSNTASNTTTTSNNTTGSGSQHSATPKYTQADPRYRAEAVIEVDQKRPFSIESTKSAPDVIATH